MTRVTVGGKFIGETGRHWAWVHLLCKGNGDFGGESGTCIVRFLSLMGGHFCDHFGLSGMVFDCTSCRTNASCSFCGRGNICGRCGNIFGRCGNIFGRSGNICDRSGNIFGRSGKILGRFGIICDRSGNICGRSGVVGRDHVYFDGECKTAGLRDFARDLDLLSLFGLSIVERD